MRRLLGEPKRRAYIGAQLSGGYTMPRPKLVFLYYSQLWISSKMIGLGFESFGLGLESFRLLVVSFGLGGASFDVGFETLGLQTIST